MTLKALKLEQRRITLIVCAGFEERAVTATQRLLEIGIPIENFLVVRFGSPENQANESLLASLLGEKIGVGDSLDCNIEDLDPLKDILTQLNAANDLVLFDITGCSRSVMLVLISLIYDLGLEFDLLYTEAEDYYPTFNEYEELSEDGDQQHAFMRLNRFEESEVLHSSHCTVESFEDFEGTMLPNYPFFLVTFLPFKRGRLSAILQSVETSVRVFIRGQPIRHDLRWRGEAVDIPNADLIDEGSVFDLETLDWRKTFKFLEGQYLEAENRFRFNFIVAPLGSKMQTVGCCLFAKAYPEVRLITSTPKQHFPNSYSIGARETFLFRGISADSVLSNVFDQDKGK